MRVFFLTLLIQNREYGWEHLVDDHAQQHAPNKNLLPDDIYELSSNDVGALSNVDLQPFVFIFGDAASASNAGHLDPNETGGGVIPANMYIQLDADLLYARPAPSADIANRPTATSRTIRYRCHWGSCASTFSRKADLDRHLQTIHICPRAYYCYFYDCPKRLGLGKGYSRWDKLRVHLREKHAAL